MRLEAVLAHDREAAALDAEARAVLRRLALALRSAPDERRELVEQAADMLGLMVEGGVLSDDTADYLWLCISACGEAQFWISRCAAEASIP